MGIDANGVVNVGAVDKSTGKKQSVTVRTSGGLSDADIERMVNEAETMREADQKKKDAVTVKNDAETLCYQVEKQLSELKDKMTTQDADELKKKMEEVKAKTKDLQELSWKVTQQAYQQASADGGDASSEEPKKEEPTKEEGNEKEKK